MGAARISGNNTSTVAGPQLKQADLFEKTQVKLVLRERTAPLTCKEVGRASSRPRKAELTSGT